MSKRAVLSITLIGIAIAQIVLGAVFALKGTPTNTGPQFDDSHLVATSSDIAKKDNVHHTLMQLEDKELQKPGFPGSVPEALSGKDDGEVVEDVLGGTTTQAHQSYIERYAATNTDILGVIEEASTDSGYWNPEIQKGADARLVPLNTIRNVSDLYVARAKIRGLRGSSTQAVDELFHVLETARVMTSGPAPVIQTAVSIDMSNKAVRAMRVVTRASDLSAEERRNIADQLDRYVRSGADVRHSLIGEYTGMTITLSKVADGKVGSEGLPVETDKVTPESFDLKQTTYYLYQDFQTMYKNTKKECGAELAHVKTDEYDDVQKGASNYVGKRLYSVLAASQNGAIKQSCERDALIKEFQTRLRGK